MNFQDAVAHKMNVIPAISCKKGAEFRNTTL